MPIGQPNEYHLKNFYTGIITQDPVLYKYQFMVTFGGADIEDYMFMRTNGRWKKYYIFCSKCKSSWC